MMILLYELAVKSEGTRFRLLWTMKLSKVGENQVVIIFNSFFLTEKLNILYSGMFKWTSVLHRGHGLTTGHLNIVI